MLSAGFSAKAFTEPRRKPDYFKYFWNQARMGGRDPGEVSRPVTMEDAFRALGLKETPDPAATGQTETFQNQHGIRLPADLRRLIDCAGIADAVLRSHPNNPEFARPGDSWSELSFGPYVDELDQHYEYGLSLLFTRGPDNWAAVFNEGDDNAIICLNSNDSWLLAAPSIGMFFWDLAQTGLVWDASEGRKIETTDIGLAPVMAE